MVPLLSVLVIAFAVWFLFKLLGGGSDKAYREGVKWGLQHPANSKGDDHLGAAMASGNCNRFSRGVADARSGRVRQRA